VTLVSYYPCSPSCLIRGVEGGGELIMTHRQTLGTRNLVEGETLFGVQDGSGEHRMGIKALKGILSSKSDAKQKRL